MSRWIAQNMSLLFTIQPDFHQIFVKKTSIGGDTPHP